jgi:diguanylate cyclase (GGDEF)-like protein
VRESVSACPPRPYILIVEDDRDIQALLEMTLHEAGMRTAVASTGEEALKIAGQAPPHLVVLDYMLPECDGLDVARSLKTNALTADVPIIMVTARAQIDDKLKGFKAGVDDYIVKPFDPNELLARVHTQLRHVERNLLSELTGLPGNRLIERTIQQTVERTDVRWAILYIDIDNFKAYNDTHGFICGNQVIQELARILVGVSTDCHLGQGPCFLGHIGGDDFIMICSANDAERVARQVIREFDETVPQFYSESDLKRGYVTTGDRRGQVIRFPLITVSIGIVTNAHRSIENHWTVGEIAAQVKQRAKALPGSSYYLDQRR